MVGHLARGWNRALLIGAMFVVFGALHLRGQEPRKKAGEEGAILGAEGLAQLGQKYDTLRLAHLNLSAAESSPIPLGAWL